MRTVQLNDNQKEIILYALKDYGDKLKATLKEFMETFRGEHISIGLLEKHVSEVERLKKYVEQPDQPPQGRD